MTAQCISEWRYLWVAADVVNVQAHQVTESVWHEDGAQMHRHHVIHLKTNAQYVTS